MIQYPQSFGGAVVPPGYTTKEPDSKELLNTELTDSEPSVTVVNALEQVFQISIGHRLLVDFVFGQTLLEDLPELVAELLPHVLFDELVLSVLG